MNDIFFKNFAPAEGFFNVIFKGLYCKTIIDYLA